MKKILDRFDEVLAAIMLIFMTLITFVNVIARYCFTASISFTDELTSKMFVLFSLLGAAIATKRKSHLGLSLISERLPFKVGRIVAILAYSLSCLFFLILIFYGIKMVIYEFSVQQTTAGLQWPEWIFGIYIPIGSAVLLLRFGQAAYEVWKKREEQQS